MKMTMLLLVSAVALLAAGAVGSPLHNGIQLNLQRIYDLAKNDSRPKVRARLMEDVPTVRSQCFVFEMLQSYNLPLVAP